MTDGLNPPHNGPDGAPHSAPDLGRLMDVRMQLTVELGQTRLPIRDLLQLQPGAVLALDAVAGEPVNLLANGTVIAKGEIVVVNDKFGLRLTELVSR